MEGNDAANTSRVAEARAQIMAEYRQSLDTAPTTDEARDQAQALEIADKALRLKALRAQRLELYRQRRNNEIDDETLGDILRRAGPAGKLADQSLRPLGVNEKDRRGDPFRFSAQASARPQVVADALGGFDALGQWCHQAMRTRLAPGFSPSTSRDR